MAAVGDIDADLVLERGGGPVDTLKIVSLVLLHILSSQLLRREGGVEETRSDQQGERKRKRKKKRKRTR